MASTYEFTLDMDGPEIPHNYNLITDPQDVPAVAQALDRAGTFALDLETTGLDHKREQIHGIALATEQAEWYVCMGAEKAMLSPLKDLAKRSMMVGHNWPFDLHFLWAQGVYPEKIFDTMIAQFLIDENQELGLKPLGRSKLGHADLPDFKTLQHLGKFLTGKKKLEDVNIQDMPLEPVARYAARDARMTFDLLPISKRELYKEGMTDIFWQIEMPFVYVLTEMEESGFYIDQQLLTSLGIEFIEERDRALATFLQLSGGVNPASPAQVAKYFYETLGYKPTLFTQKNAPSTDVLAISRLAAIDKTGAAQSLLTFRKYEKLIGTYITSFREKMVGGYLYGHFNQLKETSDDSGKLPRTGRLSSSEPNLQNIPSKGEIGARIRELFGAPEGYSFLDIDYSQLELRIAAHYTKDRNLLKVFAEGGDPHQLTADRCEVERHIAKTLNFGNLYGQGPRKFCDVVEKSGKPRPELEDAKEWLRRFGAAYPDIASWKRRVIEYARDLGYVRTIGGRKRRLPDIRCNDTGLRAAAERQAVNTIIQGSAADIVKYAMLQAYPIQKQFNAALMAQVHDELAWRVRNDVVEEFGNIASGIMEGAGEHFNMRVHLEAKPSWGRNWTEAKGK